MGGAVARGLGQKPRAQLMGLGEAGRICHMSEATVTHLPDPSGFSDDPLTDLVREGGGRGADSGPVVLVLSSRISSSPVSAKSRQSRSSRFGATISARRRPPEAQPSIVQALRIRAKHCCQGA